MSSYRRLKHVYDENWEDSHSLSDLCPVTEGCDDPIAITLQNDPTDDDESFDWGAGFLTVVLDPI